MTGLTISTTRSDIQTNQNNTTEFGQNRSPRRISNENSSLSQAPNNDNSTIVPNSQVQNGQNFTNNPSVVASSTVNRSALTTTTRTKGSSDNDPEPSGKSSNHYDKVTRMVSNILIRFLFRMPHTFIALGGVYCVLNYGLGKENMAYSAMTFVGVGGTAYCLVRAIFKEIIPEKMLATETNGETYRHLLNITYTCAITVTTTSAVWKLPDLSAAQGLAFLGLFFGVPYLLLSKLHPDSDKEPKWPDLNLGN